MKTIMYNLKTIKIGSVFISGRYNLDYKLWDYGYRVRIIFKYFVLYEKL